ncbi:MAG: rhomboid family intramembrane serine protease [Spirochaetia bacterium]|nr:rhomboid family intramembrane serine protease [Spirochaetia bacterium]
MKQPVTKILVATSVLIHVFVWYLLPMISGSGAAHDFVNRFALLPVEFRDGAVWQPLTAVFLHTGILHLVFCMVTLWSLGQAVENTLGSMRYGWLCFVTASTSSLAVIFIQPELEHPGMGTSGLIMGLLGALAVYYPNSTILVFFLSMRARTAAIVFGALSILLPLFGIVESISPVNHIAGLIAGVLYARFALGLRYGAQNLNPQEDNFLRKKLMEQDRVRELFDGMKRVRPERWQTQDYPQEKVINPTPEETQAPPAGDAKRLHYDPTTGKFFFR